MRLVLCYCPLEAADQIRTEIIQKQLAACVNTVSNVKRIYKQDEQLIEEQQSLLLIQTLTNKLQKLMDTIIELHPSETPAIISLPIYEGNRQYMDWVEETLYEAG